jgi:hypothetical protein
MAIEYDVQQKCEFFSMEFGKATRKLLTRPILLTIGVALERGCAKVALFC